MSEHQYYITIITIDNYMTQKQTTKYILTKNDHIDKNIKYI